MRKEVIGGMDNEGQMFTFFYILTRRYPWSIAGEQQAKGG